MKGVTTVKREIDARVRLTAELVRRYASRVHGVIVRPVSRAMNSVTTSIMIVIRAPMRTSSGVVITRADQALSSAIPVLGLAATLLRTAIVRLSRVLTLSYVAAVVNERECVLRQSGALGANARWWVSVPLESAKKVHAVCVASSVVTASPTVSGVSGRLVSVKDFVTQVIPRLKRAPRDVVSGHVHVMVSASGASGAPAVERGLSAV